jgi:hypothetical protein
MGKTSHSAGSRTSRTKNAEPEFGELAYHASEERDGDTRIHEDCDMSRTATRSDLLRSKLSFRLIPSKPLKALVHSWRPAQKFDNGLLWQTLFRGF